MAERGEIAGLRKDGTEFPVEASISKLDLGEQRIFTVTLRDVSERKRAEEHLRQAQKMEAIGQLTGGIAHDFNNLLGVILGNAELLSDRLGEDDRQIRALLRATTRGAELAQRMLAFSRQQPLQPRAIDVGVLADGMMDLLRRTLGETIAIKITVAEDLWTATADPGLVENALLNLAINARDAMPDGGTLIVEAGNVTLDETYAAARDDVAAGDYVLLSVTDTGTGMTPEVLSHVFEPFYTTKDVGEGSGLGLSMVYGFAKQSGGHIAIYSELGQGTTVNLYLPWTGAAAESNAMAPPAEVPRGRGEAVLVVEDDEDIRATVAGMLEDFGYRVREAPDGAAGLALLEEAPELDLLITDMVLPGGMNGRDLAAEVERRFGVLKVLFMSGYSAEAVHLNGWVNKGDDLLRKPFRRHELATKVRAVLDRGAG
jgi:signal transduction histidine kinase